MKTNTEPMSIGEKRENGNSRTPAIIMGLLVFASGSLLSTVADSLIGMVVGHGMQGAGLVLAIGNALLADHRRRRARDQRNAEVSGDQ